MPFAVLSQASPEYNSPLLGSVYGGFNLDCIDCLRCASSALISFTASLGNLVAGTGLGRNGGWGGSEESDDLMDLGCFGEKERSEKFC